MKYQLPGLAYAYNALEPFIDAQTMEIHHSKHHQAYVDNLNKAIAGTELENSASIEELLGTAALPVAVRNNGGGHYNHSLFWQLLKPKGELQPIGALALAINETFGSFDVFKTKFAEAATTRFGSGWAWLVLTSDKKISITSTPNQDNPLMGDAAIKGTPIIALDVWEHAYYLKYQNKRPDYISAFWNVLNWELAEQHYQEALKK